MTTNDYSTMRFAYLISRYPAANHTFILREITVLRDLGFDLLTASISSPDRPHEAMTPIERDEQARTFYVKAIGSFSALRENVAELLGRPRRYIQGLLFALSLSHWQPRCIVPYIFYFAEAVIVGRWMRREELSLLHTHFSSTVALIANRMFPIEISMTIHGPGEFDEPFCFNLKEKVAAASLIVAISNYGKSQLMKISNPAYWKKLEVVYLGIEGAVFSPQPPRSAPEPFEVICVGRLAPVKGHEVLIEAIALLIGRGKDIRLRLVGDGPERSALEKKVRALGLTGHVLFEGWKNQTELIELYKNSDAFALASFAEGVPVVLMEAMSMQIPCIATRITGIPELITDGVDGLLVSPGSSDELAEALMRLMNDLPLRERLARCGRATVTRKYDLRRNTEQLADVFRKRFLEIEGRHESTRVRMMHSEDAQGAGDLTA